MLSGMKRGSEIFCFKSKQLIEWKIYLPWSQHTSPKISYEIISWMRCWALFNGYFCYKTSHSAVKNFIELFAMFWALLRHCNDEGNIWSMIESYKSFFKQYSFAVGVYVSFLPAPLPTESHFFGYNVFLGTPEWKANHKRIQIKSRRVAAIKIHAKRPVFFCHLFFLPLSLSPLEAALVVVLVPEFEPKSTWSSKVLQCHAHHSLLDVSSRSSKWESEWIV